ncbi:hypothetical protein L226DRAFT_508472 [Lentinus tigrinus ALCF2SS1-7]|uniref:Pali-domain-containing protein n=1 Tax=Lentinus tigrinus ALCF2SS1-6 TaxID=1328759 RepID=A0A5C2SA84_9APHY|nr:hypothetical protein L227DRAFT_108694 [Lentinus tigrinus ALCF2SS1-6]RPD74883.1 hypothetical protein L226DRAFT_508472 [Lentinus tigrinus ALCF2SS1-7]
MCGPTFLMFLATIAALVLLVLVIFSQPFIHVFYFLSTSAEGGLQFGVLGFCNVSTGVCSQKKFGYEFLPELLNPLPIVLVLYPVAAGLALLGAVSLLPLFYSRRPPRWPYVVFGMLSMLAFLAAAAAFGITMWLFTVARDRFRAEGFTADYGPSTWMALAAAAVLLLVAMNAGCGTCMGGRFGRQARHLAYTY